MVVSTAVIALHMLPTSLMDSTKKAGALLRLFLVYSGRNALLCETGNREFV